MRLTVLCLTAVALLLAACEGTNTVTRSPDRPAAPSFVSDGEGPSQFWRAISWPNLAMPAEMQQRKLDFDLNLCRCSNFPRNLTQGEVAAFNPDQQRLAETSATQMPSEADPAAPCVAQPNLVLAECMRGRGWEQTDCLGRSGVAGAFCPG